METQLEEFDLVILGGGTGSTIAAWTFAGEGKRVAAVDRKYTWRTKKRGAPAECGTEASASSGCEVVYRCGRRSRFRPADEHGRVEAHRRHELVGSLRDRGGAGRRISFQTYSPLKIFLARATRRRSARRPASLRATLRPAEVSR